MGNEYEFIPLTPITHDSLPEEMRDFISSCGMKGIIPRRSFANPSHGILGQVIDLKTVEDGLEIERALESGLKVENDANEYVRFRDVEIKDNSDVEIKDNSDVSNEAVEEVLKSIETNNLGVLKFLQANGMPYDKARKFVKRIVRLSLRYGE